jgi:ubiquitin carboxyl-terminal hydrolase 4/11/15
VYAQLIESLWSGTERSISPWELKRIIAKVSQQFLGYSQHDSHELITFLIDGLHEDLNQIFKKPYCEGKDNNPRPDNEVALETWNNHLSRNKSIIIDLMHGLEKSTLICPTCKQISVTFDP